MKTRKELQEQIDLECKLKDERTISDSRYAIKLIEKIVFGMCAAVLMGALAAILNYIYKLK